MSSRSRTKAGRRVPALLLGAALAGCSDDAYLDRRETVALHAGDAMATNRVTHTIDPWSPASANRNIAFNGERMQTAPSATGPARDHPAGGRAARSSIA